MRRAKGRRGDRGRTPSMIWRSGRAGCCPRPGCWEQTPPPGRLCGSRSRRSRTGVAHSRAPGGNGRLTCGRPAGGECQTSALHRLLTLGVRWHAPRHRHNGPRLRQASTPPPGTQVDDRLSPDQRGRARRPPTPMAATEGTADGPASPRPDRPPGGPPSARRSGSSGASARPKAQVFPALADAGYAVPGFASWTSVRFTRSTCRRYSLRSASILCHSPLASR